MARLTDEIIDEIHAIRQQHAVLMDHDMGRIIDDLHASQDQRVANGWPLIKAAPEQKNNRDPSLQRSRFAHRWSDAG